MQCGTNVENVRSCQASNIVLAMAYNYCSFLCDRSDSQLKKNATEKIFQTTKLRATSAYSATDPGFWKSQTASTAVGEANYASAICTEMKNIIVSVLKTDLMGSNDDNLHCKSTGFVRAEISDREMKNVAFDKAAKRVSVGAPKRW